MSKRRIEVGPDIDLDDEVVVIDGKRVTEADAEAWSDEIAADRSWDNLVPGRKSLSGGSKHSPVVNVRVAESTRRRLEELAAQSGVTVSKVARQAIDEFLSRH